MARTLEDIISMNVVLRGNVSIDLERVEADTFWLTLKDMYLDHSFEELLFLYLSHYIQSDKFLSEAPFTNGPGSLTLEHGEANG